MIIFSGCILAEYLPVQVIHVYNGARNVLILQTGMKREEIHLSTQELQN